MFDFGSGELLVIGVVALVVIGPKELPGMLRTVGKTVARIRRMAGEFQGQFHDALREADLHDAMKTVTDIQSSVSEVTNFDTSTPAMPLAAAPAPVLPESIIVPSTELQPPPSKATENEVAQDEKPKKATRAKKPKADIEPPKDDAQAALFDTLDGMATKADDTSPAPDEIPAKKPRRATKPKSTDIVATETGDAPAPKAKRKAKTAKTSASDEAAS